MDTATYELFAARCPCSRNIGNSDTLRQQFGIEDPGLPSDGAVFIVRTRAPRLYILIFVLPVQ